MNKMQEMYNKDLQELENKQTGINSRITEAEEWINDLENRMVEITATEPNIGKRKTKKMKTA